MVRCRCCLLYELFDDVRGWEVHIVSVYEDGGHWLYFVLDDMYYEWSIDSFVRRN